MLKRPCIALIDRFEMTRKERKQCKCNTWARAYLVDDGGPLYVTIKHFETQKGIPPDQTRFTTKEVDQIEVVLAAEDVEGVELVRRAVKAGFLARERFLGDVYGKPLNEVNTVTRPFDWRFSSSILGQDPLFLSGKKAHIGNDWERYTREEDGFHHYMEEPVIQEIFDDRA